MLKTTAFFVSFSHEPFGKNWKMVVATMISGGFDKAIIFLSKSMYWEGFLRLG